jgi:uncharacterized phiE125 gp8 family phage protein
MPIILVPPAGEPLSLLEAKAFLRVEHEDDDAVIAALIAAARGQIEALTRRALLTQTWRVVRDGWPKDGRLILRSGPLRRVVAARVFDAAGVSHALDVQRFVVDVAADAVASPGWAWPAPGRAAAGIELDVELGYGTEGADVPAPLRQALRMLVAHWYDFRGVVAIGGNAALLPTGVAALLGPYRGVSL